MTTLQGNFHDTLNDVIKIVKDVEGYLTLREMKFLFLLGIYPTARGTVLEIGSFKGKSTIILAKALSCSGGNEKVIAVDPLTSPSVTDPDLKGIKSGWNDFQNNIKMADIEDNLEFHRMFSYEFAKGWNRNIRLLWIDGDHTYKGTKTDFDIYSRYLSDGAIIAFHDTLANFEGPIRVFMEDVLLSNKFGPSGLCGTIGWAQYLEDKNSCLRYKEEKIILYSKLSRLIPYALSNKRLHGIKKFRYKILRSLVPHSEINPQEFIQKVHDMRK